MLLFLIFRLCLYSFYNTEILFLKLVSKKKMLALKYTILF